MPGKDEVDKEVLIVAGENGAKSTFAGAMYHHVRNKMDDYGISYFVDQRGREEFEEYVLERMANYKYPEQTVDGYLVEYDIDGEYIHVPDTKVRFIDFPGERQDAKFEKDPNDPDVVDIITEIRRGELSRDNIIDKFENEIPQNKTRSLQSRIRNGGSPTSTDEWELTYKYRYITCDTIIFILNLQKVMEQDLPPDVPDVAYDADALAAVASEKSDIAVIPTALDLAQYNPSEFSPAGEGLLERGIEMFLNTGFGVDEKMCEQIDSYAESARVNNILDRARQESGIDLFGVSVPSQTRDSKTLVDAGNSTFETKGFENVVRWLRQ